MKKILFGLLILSLYAQESSDSSDDEGAAASTSAQAAKRYKCPYLGCTKSYDYKSKLTIHERSHTGERPYACSHQGCYMSFALADSLKRHEYSHAEKMPFVCKKPGCGRSFERQYLLTSHMRMHARERLHACTHPGCGMSFARNYLKIHQDKHANTSKKITENLAPDISNISSHETPENEPLELTYGFEIPLQQSFAEEGYDPYSLNVEEDEKEEPSSKRQRLEKDNL